jgi:hypothetical protein
MGMSKGRLAGLLLACVLLCFSGGGQATSIEEDPGPVYTQVIKQWLDVTEFAKNSSKTTVEKLKMEMQHDPRLRNILTPPFVSELEKFFYDLYSSPEMIKALAMLYVQYFTLDDMLDLIKFYQSPSGQKFIKANPALIIKSQEISEKLMKEHQREYLEIIKKYVQPGGQQQISSS